MSMVCPSWLSFILYNPVRKAFTDRQKVLDDSGITQDSVVLEIGAGNGFFTEAIAARAKRVIAVELQAGMVEKLRKRIGSNENITIIQSDAASFALEEETADACLLYYSFHEVSRKTEAASTISRAIKKNGILSIYEPKIEVSNGDMMETIKLFEQNGFTKESERDGTFTRFARLRKTS